jgi:hypothetical protein
MKPDLRNRSKIEAAVVRFLAARGQQLMAVEPEPLVQTQFTQDRLSVEAEAFSVIAKFEDGAVQTYHWAYEPMARPTSNSGLKRLVSNRWIDTP